MTIDTDSKLRKNGYWRVNPDGTQDWIETNAPPPKPEPEEEEVVVAEEPAPAIDVSPLISPGEVRDSDVAWAEWSNFFNRTGQFPDTPADQDLAPLFDSWKSVVQQWQLEHPEIEVRPQEVAGMPEMPDVNPVELATLYGVDVVRFFGPVQLADLALPREERTLNWEAPFEQFLTWEQAQWVGIQGVPEGGVVRVTPMADGTLSYTLMPGPGEPGFGPAVQAEVDERREELLTALRLVFPEEFDPAMSFGISPENLPEAVLLGFRKDLATDYERTVAELFERAGAEQGESILRMMGVTEENILRTLDFKEQEVRVETMIEAVFPDHSLEDLAGLVETDWPLFVETMRWKGITAEKQALLQYMGWSPQEINSFFNVVTVPAIVDGFQKILTVDVASMRAFDQQGNQVGTYNVITQEFTALPEEDWLKDVWDAFVLGGQHLIHQGKQFLFSALPNFLFRDLTEFERSIYGDEYVNRVNALNAVHRDRFRTEYSRNERINEEWMAAHPELVPPEWTRGNIVDRLKEDPLKTIFYEFASTAPFMIAVMGTTIGVTALTGNVALGLAAGAAVATPPQAQDAHDALLAAGATENQAGLLALPIGLVMSAIEVVGDLPYLKQMFPSVFKLFSKEITEEIATRTLANLAKKGLRTFTTIEITEALEEVMQDAVLNAGIRTFDENQALFEDWTETALRTLVATLPLALFGGVGTSLQRVTPADAAKLTDEQKKAGGFEQDPKTGNWYQPMKLPAALQEFLDGERGALGRPAEVLKVLPTPAETRLYKELQRAGAEIGLSVEAVQGIAEGEYWVAITTKTGAKDAFSDWVFSLTDKGIDPLEVRRSLEGSFPEKVGEIGRTTARDRRRFLPFTNLEAAKKFIETGDLKNAARSIELKGTPWTAEQLAQANAALLEAPAAPPAILAAPEVPAPTAEEVAAEPGVTPEAPKVIGRTPSGEANLLQTPDGVIIERVATGKRAGWWKIVSGTVEVVGKTPESVLKIARSRGLTPEVPAAAPARIKPKTLPAAPKEVVAKRKRNRTGVPKRSKQDVAAIVSAFTTYLNSPTTANAMALTEKLRTEERSKRIIRFTNRLRELVVNEGLTKSEAIKQAADETLKGELPSVDPNFFQEVTNEVRDALMDHVYYVLEAENDLGFELLSTYTALSNALAGKPIPRTRGRKGGSAFTRLQRVFGGGADPLMPALDKVAKQRKPLSDIVRGLYHRKPQPQIDVDKEMQEWLSSLDIRPAQQQLIIPAQALEPSLQRYIEGNVPELFEVSDKRTDKQRQVAADILRIELAPQPVGVTTKFDAPIDKAFKQYPLMSFAEKQAVVRILKEAGLTIIDIGNLLRANKASVDFSFWRQAKLLASGHPVAFYAANVQALKAMWSQKEAEAHWKRITSDPDFEAYEQVRIETGADPLRVPDFAPGTARYRGSEEFGFLAGAERPIPKFTAKLWHVKLSSRSFVTGLNEIVWRVWKDQLAFNRRYSDKVASGEIKLAEGESFSIIEEMKGQQRLLSNMVQRGSLGREGGKIDARGLAPMINATLFAARSKLGRFFFPVQLLGFANGKFSARVMREAWKDFVLMNSIIVGTLFLGQWLGLWTVEDDPRNAEFMSIRIGNLRIDPWAGYRQFVVLYTRLFTGTGVSSVTGAEFQSDPIGSIVRFFRSSVAPLPAILIDFWTGRNFIGEVVKITDARQWLERIAPFAVWDMYEAFEEGTKEGIISIIPAILGEGVQTYTGDWVKDVNMLGLPKYAENAGYGIVDPKYTTADFWADYASAFKGVDPGEITLQKGFPAYMTSLVTARRFDEELALKPNQKLVAINANPADGLTFKDYYANWQTREALVAAGDNAEWKQSELVDGKRKVVTYTGDDAVRAFDANDQYKKSYLGNMTREQYALLVEHHLLEGQAQEDFLEQHIGEIGINPRTEALRSNTDMNGLLALWGQEPILTKAAYEAMAREQAALGFSDGSIPPLTVPPEESLDNYFERLQAVADFGGSSAEAVWVLAKDPTLLKWYQEEARIAGTTPLATPRFPERYYELKVKNRNERERWEGLSNKTTDEFIEDMDERLDTFYREFPDSEYFDDNRRTEALAAGWADEDIEAWVERGRLVDKESAGSPLVKEWAFDNPDAYRLALEEKLLNDRGGLATDEERGHYDEWVEPAVRLQAKNVEEDGYWNLLGDKQEPETYIDDEANRRAAFFERFPGSEYFDDVERIEAYKEGFTDKEADLWAERGRLLGTVEPLSAEAKVWLLDHQDLFDKAIDAGMLQAPDDWNEPALRVLAKWRAQYNEYDALPAEGTARDDYLAGEGLIGDELARRVEYRKDRRRREAHMMKNSATGATFPASQIEKFVEYHEIEVKGMRQERFLVENPAFAQAMHEVNGMDIRTADEVPAVQFDDIYDEFRDDFDKVAGLPDNESEHYIEDTDERDAARDAMRFDENGHYTDFGLAEIRRNGYGGFVPEEHIEAFVGYYKIIGEGKPDNWKLNTGTELWYDDDWFLEENPGFYQDVYIGLKGNESLDFSKVPPREVFTEYLAYLQLPTLFAKDAFRWENRELDAWLVLKFEYTPIEEKRRRSEMTMLERFQVDWDARQKDIEEALRKLRGE